MPLFKAIFFLVHKNYNPPLWDPLLPAVGPSLSRSSRRFCLFLSIKPVSIFFVCLHTSFFFSPCLEQARAEYITEQKKNCFKDSISTVRDGRRECRAVEFFSSFCGGGWVFNGQLLHGATSMPSLRDSTPIAT